LQRYIFELKKVRNVSAPPTLLIIYSYSLLFFAIHGFIFIAVYGII